VDVRIPATALEDAAARRLLAGPVERVSTEGVRLTVR
jgi:hypothetical protein